MVSVKKAQASRDNGHNSHGPTSAEGKRRVRLNAVKNGLFAKDLVIPEAGESQDELNEFRSRVWDHFQPQNVVAEMLVNDLISTYWRLQRPRRCEKAEICKRLATASYRRFLEKEAEVKTLKSRFLNACVERRFPSQAQPPDVGAINRSLEETRRALERSSLGLEFLIKTLEDIKESLEAHGYVPPDWEVLLLGVCGIEDDYLVHFTRMNEIAKQEVDKLKKCDKERVLQNERKTRKPNFAQLHKQVFSLLLSSKLYLLNGTRRMIQELEAAEEKAHIATLVLPPTECLERIHRAESAMERRFYKALNQLSLQAQDPSCTSGGARCRLDASWF